MPQRTIGRRIMTLILVCLGLYALAALAVMLLQRAMIYHPGRAAAGVLEAAANAEGFEPWANGADTRIGWKRLHGTGAARGRALIFHGNAGYALDRADYAKALQTAMGFDVYILEYPGYADRPGAPSQKALYDAAEEAFQLLRPNGPVHVVGESLGTGVAAYLAGTHPESVGGLFLFTPFNNLASVAQRHMPIFPVRWILWDRFPSDEFLEKYHGPVAVMLAGNDEVVPNEFGRRLFDGYGGPKKLWEVPGAAHNDVHTQPPEFWKAVAAFWESHR
jgi:pimeloyl-ACP methyl ester carboxylesterase